MDSTTDSRFQSLYLAVITSALYGCTWFACLYWPSFIGYLFFPQQIVRIEMIAIFIMLPAGLTILGALEGLKRGCLHFLISVVAIVGAAGFILATGRDSEADFIRSLMLAVIFLTYAVSGSMSYLRRIKKELT